MSLLALTSQLLYFRKQEFSSKTLYDSYLGMLILRVLITLIISGIFLFKNFIRYTNDMLNVNNYNSARECERMENIEKLRNQTKCHGLLLYLSYPTMLYFGFYRLYKPKDFKFTIYAGYFVEMFLALIPIVFIQQTNNTTMKDKTMNELQNYSLAIQILVIFEIFFQNFINYCES